MNKCSQCRNLFERCRTKEIPHYEVDTRIYETICVCPWCGSEDFEEASLCPTCEEAWIKSPEDYCAGCYADVSRAVGELAETKGISFADAVALVADWAERY